MRHLLSIIFGTAFTATVCWAIGLAFFHRLRIELHREEHHLLAATTGAAILSLLIFLLCALHIAAVGAMWTLGIASLVAAYKWRSGRLPRFPATPLATKLLFYIPFIAYALFYFAHSLGPENSPDGSTYHLGLVYRYFRQHGFEHLTTNMYANLSAGMEMIYLFAFSFGRQSAAATVHCCSLLALALLMYAYGRRIGHATAGAFAAMLVFLSPVAGVDATSAYNDVGLALAGFATFYLTEIWRESEDRALLIPIGLLGGFCFAIKYTGFVALLYVAIVIGEKAFKTRRVPWRAIATLTACASLLALPWLIKNWIIIGNPLSPFYNRLFPNPYIHISFEDDYRKYLQAYDLIKVRSLFWILTVRGSLGGQLGPAFLLAPFALLVLWKPQGRRLFLAALIFLIPYPQNIGSRFLIPLLPFLALSIALAFNFSRGLQTTIVVFAAICAWPGVIDIYRAGGGSWDMGYPPIRAVLGKIPMEKWFTEHAPGWVSGQFLDTFVPHGKRVWITGTVAEGYSKSEVISDGYAAEGELIQDILTGAIMPDRQPTRLYSLSFAPHRLQHLRIVQNQSDPAAQWNIAEISIFRNGIAVPRTNKWSADARPFPWDIAFALDNNPATRWNTWEPIAPGMHVDLNFGSPIEADRIEMRGTPGQPVRLSIEGIASKMDIADVRVPAGLRAFATGAVKQRGVEYLMVVDGHWLAEDMKNSPEQWNMKIVAVRGVITLYRIQ